MRTIDDFLIDDAVADAASYESLARMLKPRVMVLRSELNFDKVSNSLVERIGHNTLSISKLDQTDEPHGVRLSDVAWSMELLLSDLLFKKEAACGSSREIFKPLTVNQLNFRPNNGTPTAR